MSRNGSGTYSLPAGNPVVTGTTISSTTHNTTLSDLATEMTDSLNRSGKGGMLAPFKATEGSVAAPGITFDDDTATGWYLVATSNPALSVGGVKVLEALTSGVTSPVSFTAYSSGATTALSASALGTGYGLVVSADDTTPVRAALRVVPQDTQPSGPNLVGDIYVTTAGVLKICTVAGTPGTWVSVGAQ